MAREKLSRLQLLSQADNPLGILASTLEKHGILLGKLIHEVGLGNILYGIESPDTDVATHAASASAHHVKYTDAAAVSAVEGEATLVLSGGLAIPTVAKTGTYTATASDHVILCDASGGAFTVTLPAASGVPGTVYHIKKTDSSGNAVTVDGNASETIDGDTTKVIGTQYDSMMIICDGSNWHII